jgi:Chaperone of endosialidase
MAARDHGREMSSSSTLRFVRSNAVLAIATVVATAVTAYGVASAEPGGRNGSGSIATTSAKKKQQLPKNSVGAKQLKKNAVNGSKVKDNSLTGADIDASTLDTVPNATHAASADNATHAETASFAENADHLGGAAASAFQLRVSGACSAGEAISTVNANGGVSCAGTGGPPSGPAGGALAGTYPNPSLHVSGGPCPNGKALTNVSSQGALTCAPSVFAEGKNFGATPIIAETGLGSGEGNTAFGSEALESIESSESNSAFGQDALSGNTTGDSNSAFGVGTLENTSVGAGNVAVGTDSLNTNITGNRNVAIGVSALEAHASGDNNIAIGGETLRGVQSGGQNVAIGGEVMKSVQSGMRNTAVGTSALRNATNMQGNSAFGINALFNDTTGSNNVALGFEALSNNTSGNDNVAIGNGGGNSLTTGGNNVDISNPGVAGESNTIRVGQQGTQTATYLAGVSGSNIGANPSVVVNGEGRLGVEVSSRRFKTDIHPLRAQLGRLMELRPVSFRYRRGDVHGPNRVQFGLLAEQVAKVYPNLVVRDSDGRPYTVLYQEMPTLLLGQVQREQGRIDRQRGKIHELQAQNRHQQAQINWLMRQVRRR